MPTLRLSLLLSAVPGLLALAGCADSALLNESYSRVYYPGENAAGGGNLPVFVFGSPFGESADQFSGEVLDAMQGWAFAYPTHFVSAGDTPPSAYRAAMVFDAKPFGPEICASPLTRSETSAQIPGAGAVAAPVAPPPAASASNPRPSRIPLTAVLCRGDTYMAWLDGSVPAGNGPESPAFRRGVGQFTASLFPSVNPDREGGKSSQPMR